MSETLSDHNCVSSNIAAPPEHERLNGSAPIYAFPTGQSNIDVAVDFLQRWHGDYPVMVVTIDPNDNAIVRYDVPCGDETMLRGLIAQSNGFVKSTPRSTRVGRVEQSRRRTT